MALASPIVDDALCLLQDARWVDVAGLPRLAFDHKLVIREAFKVLASKVASGEAS